MPHGEPLLDTNAAIALLNRDGVFLHRFVGRDFCLSIVSLGEPSFGAAKSQRPEENTRSIRELVNAVILKPLTPDVAAVYGALKHRLRAAGRPVPDNDLWIAATAIKHDLALFSRDKHFEGIEGLKLEAW